MKIPLLATVLALLGSHLAWATGFLEREIQFSEAEVQAQVDRNGTMRKSVANGLLVVALLEPPRVQLGKPEGKASVTARLEVALLGQPAIPLDVQGASGLRYDEAGKAFFLDNPVIHAVQSSALPREYEALARLSVNQLISAYFRREPVHVLNAAGTPQAQVARWLLRSIRIEPGRVIAVLSPP